MRSARLSLALDTGALVLPAEGRIALFRPTGDEDLSALPRDRIDAIQSFRPDHDALTRRGLKVSPEASGSYAAAIVCLPRAKAEGRALVAEAARRLPEGAPLWVDGQKTDGIDSMLKDLRGRVEVGAPLSKAHGKLISFANPGAATFADWQAAPRKIAGDFVTLPGVFSADGPDRGSVLLAEALPAKLPARVGDFGAGWGYLSRAILARDGVEELHLIEAEKTALDCARSNVTDPRAQFHWADATQDVPGAPFQAVVTNPPFHQGRAADPDLGLAFLASAARQLTGMGTLWLVANRNLPYERSLAALFREVEEIASDGAFKVLHATGPMTRARPRAH
ncbi:class I SAM-dependent methyltransferase [Acidimangrovimonas sediminis]|uniref:class I SAM-dependent methyltransferase n=1 Tax=Acidimangrovimonas sediminis TaxID=2056283 RepID=UPI000C7F9684|nr:class I SAM-dependent methyltransferase [Acidimangrovimonas sediminis]